METRYEVNGWTKIAEEDVYAEGCLPETTVMADGNDRFAAETLPELIEKLMSWAGTDSREDVLLNSCDEDGRVDIQTMETGEGTTASQADLDRWKEGREKLWAATYIFHVEKVNRWTEKLLCEGFSSEN